MLDYDYDHFISYAYYLRQEMTKRGYRTMDSVWKKIISLKSNWKLISFNEIYENKMDTTYLKICCFNLKEKYLCGGINKDIFFNITHKMKEEGFLLEEIL